VSFEWLLLLVFFVLLPLVERLLRAARQQQDAAAPEPPGAPRPQAPPLPLPLPRPVAPPLSMPRPRAGQARPRHPPAVTKPAPARRPVMRRPAMAADLRHAPALRRAIVLMTILGPCRALSPHAWEGASGVTSKEQP